MIALQVNGCSGILLLHVCVFQTPLFIRFWTQGQEMQDCGGL